MHPTIAERSEAFAAVCRRYGVVRLEVFGSAARGTDFDPAASDVDFLVQFGPSAQSLSAYLDFKQELEKLLGRPVDLIERGAIEASRNFIRRRAILDEAETVYG